MHKIYFTKEAFFDIVAAILWYEEQRTGLSYDFELCLEAGIEEVLRNPELFQKRYKQVKIRFISRLPHGIHYIFIENQITVIGVFHTSSSPKNWSKRIHL